MEHLRQELRNHRGIRLLLFASLTTSAVLGILVLMGRVAPTLAGILVFLSLAGWYFGSCMPFGAQVVRSETQDPLWQTLSSLMILSGRLGLFVTQIGFLVIVAYLAAKS